MLDPGLWNSKPMHYFLYSASSFKGKKERKNRWYFLALRITNWILPSGMQCHQIAW